MDLGTFYNSSPLTLAIIGNRGSVPLAYISSDKIVGKLTIIGLVLNKDFGNIQQEKNRENRPQCTLGIFTPL